MTLYYGDVEVSKKSFKDTVIQGTSFLSYLSSATDDVIIGEYVTKIGANAFYGKNNCTINLPNTITSINVFAFDNTENLIINIDLPENSIDGAPWSGVNNTINWLG